MNGSTSGVDSSGVDSSGVDGSRVWGASYSLKRVKILFSDFDLKVVRVSGSVQIGAV